MKQISVLGAGRSSSSLIRYLLNESEENGWKVRVCDRDVETARAKVANHKNGEVVEFDVFEYCQLKYRCLKYYQACHLK